ncbi:MAG: rhodanese-like domain-containing protein [Motiliproteus sp.]
MVSKHMKGYTPASVMAAELSLKPLELTRFSEKSVMEQFIEFATNHWELVAALVVTLAALWFTETQKGGKSVSTHIATQMINKEEAIIVDIRDKKDFKAGHIMSALNLPIKEFDQRAHELTKHKEKPVIVMCNLGQASSSITKKLKESGFSNVVRLQGGITEWRAQNLPLVKK